MAKQEEDESVAKLNHVFELDRPGGQRERARRGAPDMKQGQWPILAGWGEKSSRNRYLIRASAPQRLGTWRRGKKKRIGRQTSKLLSLDQRHVEAAVRKRVGREGGGGTKERSSGACAPVEEA